MRDLLRVYFDPDEIGTDGYPYAWHHRWSLDGSGAVVNDVPIKDFIRERDGHRCLRCGHPYKKGMNRWSPCDERCTHEGPCRYNSPVGSPQGLESSMATWRITEPEAFLRGYIEAEWRILTVHHLNGVKHDCRWWNLVSLCQRCHLTIQGKVVMERVYPLEHSEWFKPFVAGYYAWVYEEKEITREEAEARMDELLAYERLV